MTRRKKILLIIGSSIAGLVLALLIAAVIVLQTSWFAKFASDKIVATVDDATGGRAAIGALHIDLRHLTIRVRDFVLHGKEPAGAQPLARVSLLEVRIKLFSGFSDVLDLQYLGLDKPQVNLIFLPDGTTNIPQPKQPSTSGGNNGLQTVVNLAVKKFTLRNGWVQVLDQKAALNARGENLRVLLNYDATHPGYKGNLEIAPLMMTTGQRPPLNIHVNLPVTIDANAVRLTNGTFRTAESEIAISASMENMNAPDIAAQLKAHVSIPELQRSLGLPLNVTEAHVPKLLLAELSGRFDQKTKLIALQKAHVALGATSLDASGETSPGSSSAIELRAGFDLPELAQLFGVTSVQMSGDLNAQARVMLDRASNYKVNGTLSSRDLELHPKGTRAIAVNLRSPFYADPFLVSMDGLRLDALGGSLRAKLFLEQLSNLSLEAGLSNFSIPVLAATATGKSLGYDGFLNGALKVRGDLHAKGLTGYKATANLNIVPGRRSLPISGALNARYDGGRGVVDVGNSYIYLPNSRLSLSGALNRQINVEFVSHNLSDLLPAINLEANQPMKSLPVVLQEGSASLTAQISGRLSEPRITAYLETRQFAVEQHPFDRLTVDLKAESSGAAIQNGALSGPGVDAHFDASIGLAHWKPTPRSAVSADITIPKANLADVMAIAGQSSLGATGDSSASVHVAGTYGNPLGSATLQILNGTVEQQPFQKVYVNANLSDQLVSLTQAEVDTAGGKFQARGSFQHPRDTFTKGHVSMHVAMQDIQLSQIHAIAKQNAGVSGTIQLNGDGAAEIGARRGSMRVVLNQIDAELTGNALRVQDQNAGELRASAHTVGRDVNYSVRSNFAGSNIHIEGRTALTPDYQTTADLDIADLSLEKALKLAGQSAIPVSGTLSAKAHVAGTMQAPDASLQFHLSKATVYDEPVHHLNGSFRYSNQQIDISALDLSVPAGEMKLSGSYKHPANTYKAGALVLTLSSTDIELSKIRHVAELKPGLNGVLRLNLDGSGQVAETKSIPKIQFSKLNADLSLSGLESNQTSLGGLLVTARTSGDLLHFKLDSNLAKSEVHGSGDAKLDGAYPIRAKLTFANVRYSNLVPLIGSEHGGGVTAPPYEALVAGNLSVNGPALEPENIDARLQIDELNLETNAKNTPTGTPAPRAVSLENKGPIVVALNHEVLRIEQMRIEGRDTSISASGSIDLKNQTEPLALQLNARIDLQLLQDADRDFYSSGIVTVDTAIHGTFQDPRAIGQIRLEKANVNYASAPVGLSNGQGLIVLNGTNATIQTLTGESGGGKITLTGYAGMGAGTPNFNIQAVATHVRVRYSGVSVTSNARITASGNLKRSLVAGTVSIQRLAYASSADAGSLLSSAAAPPSTPASPSPLLSGMRLDIHIVTAPDMQISSTYANRLSLLANLTLRGTAENPGMLGRVNVTDGQLVFFGNTYTVTTGNVNFYDPNAIAPILNVSLETVAQGVNVTLGVSGPMNDLKLSYRSDPPLTFEQIVQLLATNTTPANPVIAAHQPTPPQQSLSQMGESAILGQAVANPLANRVQRVFGLTQLKIDPSFSSSNGLPSARVTLQQKIASNITFTYITDVSQTNGQIVRVQWDLTNNLSAVALRDFNGNVSVEMFYKFRRR